jgi:hypothetical protein
MGHWYTPASNPKFQTPNSKLQVPMTHNPKPALCVFASPFPTCREGEAISTSVLSYQLSAVRAPPRQIASSLRSSQRHFVVVSLRVHSRLVGKAKQSLHQYSVISFQQSVPHPARLLRRYAPRNDILSLCLCESIPDRSGWRSNLYISTQLSAFSSQCPTPPDCFIPINRDEATTCK